MKTLKKPLENIGFVERETQNGKTIANKCGRDFLYFALNYLRPDTYNPQFLNPTLIDESRLFGRPMPAFLAWTQLQFSRVPELLRLKGLYLTINQKRIDGFDDFVGAILFSQSTIGTALQRVEECIDDDTPAGIDFSLGMAGLLDHVVFVYGYDKDFLYICDTHFVADLHYHRVDERFPHFYRLPKSEVRDRWTRFGRVWEVRGYN